MNNSRNRLFQLPSNQDLWTTYQQWRHSSYSELMGSLCRATCPEHSFYAPEQPRRILLYHSKKEAKSLLSWCIFCVQAGLLLPSELWLIRHSILCRCYLMLLTHISWQTKKYEELCTRKLQICTFFSWNLWFFGPNRTLVNQKHSILVF